MTFFERNSLWSTHICDPNTQIFSSLHSRGYFLSLGFVSRIFPPVSCGLWRDRDETDRRKKSFCGKPSSTATLTHLIFSHRVILRSSRWPPRWGKGFLFQILLTNGMWKFMGFIKKNHHKINHNFAQKFLEYLRNFNKLHFNKFFKKSFNYSQL